MRVRIPLTDMDTGEMGTVIGFLGGRGVNNRLMSLGIRPGVNITKVSSVFGRGPVVIRVGNSKTALGFGMSYKVIVEVER